MRIIGVIIIFLFLAADMASAQMMTTGYGSGASGGGTFTPSFFLIQTGSILLIQTGSKLEIHS